MRHKEKYDALFYSYLINFIDEFIRVLPHAQIVNVTLPFFSPLSSPSVQCALTLVRALTCLSWQSCATHATSDGRWKEVAWGATLPRKTRKRTRRSKAGCKWKRSKEAQCARTWDLDWRLRSDRNCWFCSFCRFCCARVGGQKLQKQLILGSWRYRSYWSSLSGICDFCSARVGGQNTQNPLKKKRVPRWVHFWSYQIFQQFLCNLPPYPGTAESTETALEIKNFKVVSVP